MESEKREIVILNCNECPCILVMQYVFQELCHAFRDRGYTVKEINKLQDLHNNHVVFLSNALLSQPLVALLANQAPDAIYIGWYWDQIDTSPLKHFIYTYENYQDKNILAYHRDFFNKMAQRTNHCPLLLRAREPKDKIGTFTRKEDLHYCYMGYKYCEDWVPSKLLYRGIYHATNNHRQYIQYEQRRAIYLRSIFAFGFQSQDNIASKHVSQRIYEGLAYGCIVLTNSKAAEDQTEGAAIYVKDPQDLLNKMTFFIANSEERKKKQEQGYDYIRLKQGTNHDAIQIFIDTVRNNYNIII